MRYEYIVIIQLVTQYGHVCWFTLCMRYGYIVIIQPVTKYGHILILVFITYKV